MRFRRSPLHPVLLAGALLSGIAVSPSASGQDPLTGAQERDSTPSDPAAMGFLLEFVDRRMYTLVGAGAEQVHLQGQMINSPAGQPSQTCRFEVVVDLRTMQMQFNTIGETQFSPQALGFARQFTNFAITTKPSFANERNVIRLSRDGDKIKLIHRPRTKEVVKLAVTEWYTKEGKPLRRHVIKTAEGVSLREETIVELMDAGNDQFVILRETTTAPGQPRKVLSFEYERIDGYLRLRRAKMEFPGNSVVCDFLLRIEPKKPARR